jgi:hypothetical protein
LEILVEKNEEERVESFESFERLGNQGKSASFMVHERLGNTGTSKIARKFKRFQQCEIPILATAETNGTGRNGRTNLPQEAYERTIQVLWLLIITTHVHLESLNFPLPSGILGYHPNEASYDEILLIATLR